MAAFPAPAPSPVGPAGGGVPGRCRRGWCRGPLLMCWPRAFPDLFLELEPEPFRHPLLDPTDLADPARRNAGELRAAACCQAVRMGSRDLADMSNGGPVGRVPTKTTCRRRTSVARSVCHQFRCHVDYQDDHGGCGGVRPGASG